jgi:hypothetical protein
MAPTIATMVITTIASIIVKPRRLVSSMCASALDLDELLECLQKRLFPIP